MHDISAEFTVSSWSEHERGEKHRSSTLGYEHIPTFWSVVQMLKIRKERSGGWSRRDRAVTAKPCPQ